MASSEEGYHVDIASNPFGRMRSLSTSAVVPPEDNTNGDRLGRSRGVSFVKVSDWGKVKDGVQKGVIEMMKLEDEEKEKNMTFKIFTGIQKQYETAFNIEKEVHRIKINGGKRDKKKVHLDFDTLSLKSLKKRLFVETGAKDPEKVPGRERNVYTFTYNSGVNGEVVNAGDLAESRVRAKFNDYVPGEIDYEAEFYSRKKKGKRAVTTLLKKTRRAIRDYEPLWLLVIVLAVAGSVLSTCIDELLLGTSWAKNTMVGISDNLIVQFLLWSLWTMFFALMAMWVTSYQPTAAGSGVPEMKVVLSGVRITKYLTLRTLVVKIIGIVLVSISGILAGREGPFVHISSMVAHNIMSLPFFHNLKTQKSRYTEMLAVGAALGVAATFSAPVGGVLFTIEVVSNYYPVRNYLFTGMCAIVSATLFRAMYRHVSLITTSFPVATYGYGELPFFIFLGVVCGVVGSFVAILVRAIFLLRRTLGNFGESKLQKVILQYLTHPLLYGFFAAFVMSLFTFPGFGAAFGLSGLKTLKQLWSVDPLDTDLWGIIGVTLPLFALSRLVSPALVSLMPIPAGLVMPVLLSGAALGRLYGETLAMWFPDGLLGPDFFNSPEIVEQYEGIVPGAYAVVGSIAMLASVTHTMSASVICFELSGQIVLLVPGMLCAVLSIVVSRQIVPSFYDLLMRYRGLLFLPELPASMYGIPVMELMRPVDFIVENGGPNEVLELLQRTFEPVYPVVNNDVDLVVTGMVSRSDLLYYLYKTKEMILEMENRSEESSSDILDTELVQRSLKFFERAKNTAFVFRPKRNRSYKSDKLPALPVHPTEFQVQPTTPLHYIHLIFSASNQEINYAVITFRGRLLGIITRDILRNSIGTHRPLRALSSCFSEVVLSMMVDMFDDPSCPRDDGYDENDSEEEYARHILNSEDTDSSFDDPPSEDAYLFGNTVHERVRYRL